MTAGVRVAAFGALLVAIFTIAALAGSAAGPVNSTAPEPEHGADQASHEQAGAPAGGGAALRVVAGDTTLTPGRAQRYAFTILDAGGRTVRDFEVEQGRRMHLIVVRRDLRRFQHLHPTQDATGAWSTRVTLPDAGVYEAIADFSTGGERHALGTDLFAAGRFEPLALPAPSAFADTDGYDVSLRDDGNVLRFTVGRGGKMITGLQPYLGARGHLVMLRTGDLAYEHAHPIGDSLAFDVGEAPPGTYRLFVQFRHADTVHTAAFTHEVAR